MAAADFNWVMLERFVFLRDDDKSFREDKRTSAACTTSVGDPFRVSFILAEPPNPTRLYVWWPRSSKLGGSCHLMAAHGNLVLIRLDYLVNESEPTFGEALLDYFVYIADPQRTPLLRRLPSCTEFNLYFGRPVSRALLPMAIGLFCSGDEFAVAHLRICMSTKSSALDDEDYEDDEDDEGSGFSELYAEVLVLRSSLSSAGGERWEIKNLSIEYQDDDYNYLSYWFTHQVVPFGNSLCWVCHEAGILFCDDLCGDSPKLTYLQFPRGIVKSPAHHGTKRLYRGLCVTEGGRLLVFVDVAHHDERCSQRRAPGAGFTITSWKLATAENCGTQWTEDAVVKSDELWATNSSDILPREVMMLPLLSMDNPNVAHFTFYDWAPQLPRASLVSIDLKDKKVLNKVVPYLKGQEALCTDDADLVKAKTGFLVHFLQTEFPKFLNLDRKMMHRG